MRPMYFVERVFVSIGEQYKYVSESNTDTEDEEWTLKPKKRKRNDVIAVSTGRYVNLKPPYCGVL